MAPGVDRSTVNAQQVAAVPPAPYPRCDRIEYQRRDIDTIRIYAFSDDLRAYLGPGKYGLLWISIHDANGNLKYSGSHNVSSYRQFDQDFTAYKGWQVTMSLTNDKNTVTLCTGRSWV